MGSPIQPLTAEYQNRLQPSDPNLPPTQSVTKLSVSESGMMRSDFGDMSVITDPAAQRTVILDHLKKEARIVPLAAPSPPPPPELPSFAMPELPPAPAAPMPIDVKDLGKRFLDGHEVEGKQYTFLPPELPKPPELPALPEAPQLEAPAPPELPPAPPLKETVSQVWSSTSLGIPMLSRTVSSFGTLIAHCKTAVPGEPDPAAFEIPPDYQQIDDFRNEPNPGL